jgi:hypothetical protein
VQHNRDIEVSYDLIKVFLCSAQKNSHDRSTDDFGHASVLLAKSDRMADVTIGILDLVILTLIAITLGSSRKAFTLYGFRAFWAGHQTLGKHKIQPLRRRKS